MVKRVGRDTAVRIDKRTATGIGCLVTIGIVLALMIVTFHAIARGDVPEIRSRRSAWYWNSSAPS